MRHRISSHIRWGRYLCLAVMLGLMYGLVSTYSDDSVEPEAKVVMSFFLIGAGVLYWAFDVAKTVEYDMNYMYIKGKSEEERIALKDIYQIKLTTIRINNRSMWKISYYTPARSRKSVRILPRLFQEGFDEFKDYVRTANKDVKIKSWSHSFDFDQ